MRGMPFFARGTFRLHLPRWEKKKGKRKSSRTLYLSLAIFRNREKVPRETRAVRKKSIDTLCVCSPRSFAWEILIHCTLSWPWLSLPLDIYSRRHDTARRDAGLWIIARFLFAGLRVCTRVALSVQLTFAAANKIHFNIFPTPRIARVSRQLLVSHIIFADSRVTKYLFIISIVSLRQTIFFFFFLVDSKTLIFAKWSQVAVHLLARDNVK